MVEDTDDRRALRDGYLDWAATLAGLGDARGVSPGPRLAAQSIAAPFFARGAPPPRIWEQVLVRSADPAAGIDEFFGSIPAGDNAMFRVDPFDIAYARAFRRNDEPIDAIIYRRVDPDAPTPPSTRFEEIATGGLVTEGALVETSAQLEPADQTVPVMLGIVDDGLPILHERFTCDYSSTRFDALWSQVLLADLPGFPATGIVDRRADIDLLLARLQSEMPAEIYRERARALYPRAVRHALAHAASHGSIMLDLAAGAPGADGDDPLREVPLLGVQLPPQSFDDTSGRRLGLPLLQAIRWMIYQAFVPRRTKALVINASLGIVAGAKNGRSFLERQIARELNRAAAYTGNDTCVELVVPFGNAYDDRLVAIVSMEPGATDRLILRLPPDDRTPSYVEVRVPSGGPELPPFEIGLRGPAPSDTLPPEPLSEGSTRNLPGLAGRLYHVPARSVGTAGDPATSDAYIVMAFAPSAATVDGDILARPGAWEIELVNPGSEPLEIVLQIQRDDSPYPRQTGARQAYFDSAEAHQFDPRQRDFKALGDDGPVTHAGTNSAYSTVPSPRLTTAGGAVVWSWQNDVRNRAPEPSEYTALGAGWSGGPPPDASAISETGRNVAGVRASGLGGSATARLAGTSSASATLARDALLQRLGHKLPDRPQSDEVRLGERVILSNPAVRS